MLNYIKDEANIAYTENGAVTNKSTLSDCLDLFSTIGAMRALSEDEIIKRFMRAYAENADIAMKILFFARDVRGGLGERRVFRIIIAWLAENHPDSLRKNVELISEYGRFDDLLCLMNTACERDAVRIIIRRLNEDMADKAGNVSLLAKWLPSVNASNAQTVHNAKLIARYLGMTDEKYRKTLVKLRKKLRIIENDLREKNYTFDYEKQPSGAMFKYRKAFIRNDQERYLDYLSAVNIGEKKLNTGNIAPYEIVRAAIDPHSGFNYDLSGQERASLNASWNALEDFSDGKNALAVVDTSGSMYFNDDARPAAVALSLGMYFAQRNKGAFHNHFIEFSEHPALIEIKGKTFTEQVEYMCSFNEIADTNIEAVLDLILNAAVRGRVPQSELPERLYIISDMEFNACVSNASATVFDNAKSKYKAKGYRLPEIVFWNVASRNRNQPVTKNEQGVALVSGCSPRLFSMVTRGDFTPYSVMMDIIESERYSGISA